MLEVAATPELAAFGFAALSRARSAVSAESDLVRRRMAALTESVERSESLFGAKAAAISELWALVNECSEGNWNGDGARPLDLRAAEKAAAFIRALSSDVPLPEPAPEPDGSISLDWIRSRNRLFSVSVSASSRLAYAWLDGSDRGHGVARFDGERIPDRVLEGIKGVVGHGSARVRPR